jgi:hypothetical protein
MTALRRSGGPSTFDVFTQEKQDAWLDSIQAKIARGLGGDKWWEEGSPSPLRAESEEAEGERAGEGEGEGGREGEGEGLWGGEGGVGADLFGDEDEGEDEGSRNWSNEGDEGEHQVQRNGYREFV